MRRTLAVCAALLAALGAGCATSGTSGQKQADQNAPATLTYWSTGGDDDTAIFQGAADLYHRSHPRVTIKVQTLTWDDAYAKILAAVTARNGPDIISGGMTWGIQFGRRGGMVDLRKYGIDPLKAQAHPAQWKSAVSPDGTIYGVPLDMSTELLYYRTDLLKKANVAAPPKTWEELTADIGKLKAAGVARPFSIDWGNLDWIGYFNFLYQAGGSFYTPDCKPALDTPQARRALDFYVGLYRTYGAPTANISGENALETGTAMTYAGNWIGNTITASKPKLKGRWAVTTIPAGPVNPTAFIGGRAIGVMSSSKHVAQSVDFIKFLYSDQAIETMAGVAKGRGVPYLPPRPDRLDRVDLTPGERTAIAESFKTGVAAPGCPGWDESAPEVAKQLQAAILGKADEGTALQRSAQVMQRNAG
ncbi:extracellular solute-binding protein [Actinoallomurus sp. CA-150999]|uniref:extracellular solute-binding protein n=1 Tax=Actinoallomurus sp. CA-150999 TaxID=3239887 RepID=UPI003D8EF863